MAKLRVLSTISAEPAPIAAIPCEHRQTTADGPAICRKVHQGHAEVAAALCATCPAALIQCPHLQFTLGQHALSAIAVRHADGRIEVWDDLPPIMRFQKAACALGRGSINTPADCAGCTLRPVGAAGLARGPRSTPYVWQRVAK